jgi:hypothetical protein
MGTFSGDQCDSLDMQPDPSRDDPELLTAVAGGDLSAILVLFDRHAPRLSACLTRRCNSPEAVSDPAQGDSSSNPRRFTMRHARLAIAILTGLATGFIATGFIATATVAYAAVAPTDSAVVPVDPHEMPGFYNNYQHVAPSTSAAGLPLWQLLAFVALGVLMAVAIVGLGHSLSHSRRPQSSRSALRS